MRLSSEYGTRHMLSNSMMKENDVKIGNMDKVFKLKNKKKGKCLFGTDPYRYRITWETPNSEAIFPP
jgi:hypothetical protein